MAESPPRDEAPPNPGERGESPKTGESDPLFNSAGLRTRKTVMGLAPAPHLGGANKAAVTEAEARKQRVLARIAAMDSNAPPRMETGPPPPEAHARAAHGTPTSSAPPPFAGDVRPRGSIVEETYIGPPHPAVVATPHISVSTPRSPSSSPGQLPGASGWDAADAEIVRGDSSPPTPAEEAAAAAMDVAPNTARMLRAAARDDVVHRTSTHPAAPVETALALRPHEAYPPFPLSVPLDPRLVLLSEPNSDRATSFRILRDALLAKSMPRVLAVSSAAPNDGKTTCAVNLALALAEQSSTRVLLIDANYFEPDLGKIFSIDRIASSVPPATVSWLAPYKLVEINPQLHVAGIVPEPGMPAVRFEQQRFEALIDRFVRVSYDYIIIDTPALLGTPFVSQLVSIADATLIAVRAGRTTAREIRRAAEQIPANKALGIALIDAQP